MHPEAAFLAGYSLVLVAVAAGIEGLGRRSTRPGASKVLAAAAPPIEPRDGPDPDWPHSEVPAFHLGLSAVVLAAALLLTAASISRHHDPTELLAQLPLLVLVGARIAHLVTSRRTLTQSPTEGSR